VAQYFGNGEYHSEFLKISQFFAIRCGTAHVDSFVTDARLLDKGEKDAKSWVTQRACIPTVQFQSDSHTDFHTILMSCAQLIDKIQSTGELAADYTLCIYCIQI
jgi:hypothetical protein